MIALDHIQAHRMAVLDYPHKNRPQGFELVDVIAVRIRETTVRLSIGSAFKPHHLRLCPDPQVHVVFILEFLMKALEISATVGCQCHTRIFPLLPVAKTDAEHTGDPLIPG